MSALLDDVDGEVLRAFHGKAPAKPRGADLSPAGWSLINYGDAIEARVAPYLVKGLVARGAFSVWFGKPKSGKSFVLLDLALHIASGQSWRGRRTRQGRVLYLPVEAGAGFVNRLAAARAKFGSDPLPFHVLPVPLNLLDGDGERLEAFVAAKAEELGGAFDLIVLDTLSRSIPGADENSPQAMTGLVGALDRLRAATGAHVAVVHHVGKDEGRGMRGHSSLLAAVDLSVEVAERTIRVGECREGPDGASWRFELEPVVIGADEDGDAITSCIVREVDGEAPSRKSGERKPRPLGPVESVVLECLDTALVDHGRAAEAVGAVARDIPRRATLVRHATLEDVVDRYMPERPGNKRREAVGRTLTSLQARGLVKHVDGWLWRPSHDVA